MVEAVSDQTCDNCARPDDDLVTVQRVYLVEDAQPTDPLSGTSVMRLDDIERWCVSCCTQYPHELIVEN
jgi:hypothetical protein